MVKSGIDLAVVVIPVERILHFVAIMKIFAVSLGCFWFDVDVVLCKTFFYKLAFLLEFVRII